MHDALSALRREVQQKAGKEGQQVLKGTPSLLLKRPETLDGEQDERERLKRALAINAPLVGIGGCGSGPGELRTVNGPTFVGDTLLVYDMRSSSAHWLGRGAGAPYRGHRRPANR